MAKPGGVIAEWGYGLVQINPDLDALSLISTATVSDHIGTRNENISTTPTLRYLFPSPMPSGPNLQPGAPGHWTVF